MQRKQVSFSNFPLKNILAFSGILDNRKRFLHCDEAAYQMVSDWLLSPDQVSRNNSLNFPGIQQTYRNLSVSEL